MDRRKVLFARVCISLLLKEIQLNKLHPFPQFVFLLWKRRRGTCLDQSRDICTLRISVIRDSELFGSKPTFCVATIFMWKHHLRGLAPRKRCTSKHDVSKNRPCKNRHEEGLGERKRVYLPDKTTGL